MKHLFSPRQAGPAIATALILAGVMMTNPRPAQAAADGVDQAKVRIGFDVAPVPLKLDNLKHAERNLVGYGSYVLNVQADCNGCHTLSPQAEYAAGGSPYFSQPTKVNPAAYLSGGSSFGNLPAPPFVEIFSRNLTPDKDGKPAGMTLSEFLRVIRTGVDMDKWHPTCTGAPNAHCVPAPFDGSLLQVMPWPAFQNMTETDLEAIYYYLSAIPCLEGDPGNPAGSDTKGTRCQ
jgi:hypothetical protein